MENKDYYIEEDFIYKDGVKILQFFDEKQGMKILGILNESLHLNHL